MPLKEYEFKVLKIIYLLGYMEIILCREINNSVLLGHGSLLQGSRGLFQVLAKRGVEVHDFAAVGNGHYFQVESPLICAMPQQNNC